MVRRSRLTLLVAAATVVAGLGTLMSIASARDSKPKRFRVTGIPFEIAEPGAHPNVKWGADRHFRFEQQLEVKVDGEKVARAVKVRADHVDASQGGILNLFLDSDGKRKSHFAFNPGSNTLGLSSATERTVLITRNPDGSYTIDGQPAPNGKAAVALLKTKPAYTGLPREHLLVAYASAQSPLPETKIPTDCGSGDTRMRATAPAVCTVFRDLCDCVACDASGGGAACSKCQ
ncbi:MAG: hypothetical protein KF764_13100 [Labilithrix sp.]|nr:hypothetical protein [Labilithrix sp.]